MGSVSKNQTNEIIQKKNDKNDFEQIIDTKAKKNMNEKTAKSACTDYLRNVSIKMFLLKMYQ